MQVKLPENKFYDEVTQYISLQTITIERDNSSGIAVGSTGSEENQLKYFLVRDDTRLMLLNFDGGHSEDIATIPMIENDVLH